MTRQITLTVVVNEGLLDAAIDAAQGQSFPTDLSWLMADVTEAIVNAVTADQDETPRSITHNGLFAGYVVADRLVREPSVEQEPRQELGDADLPQWIEVQADVVRTDEGVTFTPMTVPGGIGYTVTDPTGRIEHVFLLPSTGHEVNVDDGATADTFMHHVDVHESRQWALEQAKPESSAHMADFAEPIVYVSHFYGTAQPDNESNSGT